MYPTLLLPLRMISQCEKQICIYYVIYLPFYKITLIARWCYHAVSHSLAIFPHFPRYTLATNDCSTQSISSESKDHPADLSNVLEYIPKAYPMGWAFYSEMCPSPEQPVVVIVHYITGTSQRDPNPCWSSLWGPSPLPEIPTLETSTPPPLKTAPLGPTPPAFTEQRLSSRGTFIAQLCMAFTATYEQASVGL